MATMQRFVELSYRKSSGNERKKSLFLASPVSSTVTKEFACDLHKQVFSYPPSSYRGHYLVEYILNHYSL